MTRRFLAAGGTALLALAALSPAVSAPVPRDHALTGVRIVVAPGRVVETGTVVIRDGVIVAAGAGVAVPADVRVSALDGASVYPGLIDAYTVAPWPQPKADADDGAPQGGHDNVFVVPEHDMSRHAFDDGRFAKLRAAGFTTAVVAPEAGVFRGASALMNLGDGGVHANLLARRVAHNATLRANDFGGGYPSSLMGAEALFRQTLYDARWYAAAHAAYAGNGAQQRPAFNSALAELADVAQGRMPIVLETGDVLGTLRWQTLVAELGLDAVLVGNGREYQRLEAVAATGLPHILPLAFPDAPEVGDGDALDVDLAALRHWQRAPENPAAVLAAGVTAAFTSHGLADPKKLYDHLATAIERGLEPDAALAALTTTPAALLGIGERAGTVEAGKMANLVVVDGELLVAAPKIREEWVDGTRYPIKVTAPPTVDPAGTWTVVVSHGAGQSMTVTLTLSGPADDLRGTIGTPGGAMPLTSAVVSADTVEIEFDSTPLGMPGTVVFSLRIDGDTASGHGTAPQGSFTAEATRTSKPHSPEVAP